MWNKCLCTVRFVYYDKNISNHNDGSTKNFVAGFDEFAVGKYTLTLSENEIITSEVSHPNVRKSEPVSYTHLTLPTICSV